MNKYLSRQKTIQFEKMKLGLKEVIEEINNEDNSLQDYQAEIEMLIQEKMAHVEELRLIHTDINTVCSLRFFTVVYYYCHSSMVIGHFFIYRWKISPSKRNLPGCA